MTRPGYVFIGEDFDDEPSMRSGRWSAHWEGDDPRAMTRGPQGVSAQEAIAWGRAQADIVLIRPGDTDTHYSAGVCPPKGEPDCPRWPEGRELPRRRPGERPDGWPALPMTRDWCAAVLLDALTLAGSWDGRIDLRDVWPTIAEWWSTPVLDLADDEEDRLAFLLSLVPAEPGETAVFAGRPPEEICGRELVCIEFGRSFSRRTGPIGRVGVGGGAWVVLWYAYDSAWQELRERSAWIEMGFATPQIDASSDGSRTADLVTLIDGSGVLETAARRQALALAVVDGHDRRHRLRVVRLDGPDPLAGGYSAGWPV